MAKAIECPMKTDSVFAPYDSSICLLQTDESEGAPFSTTQLQRQCIQQAKVTL